MALLSTQQVADQLGVTYRVLHDVVRCKKIPAPRQTSRRHYTWTVKDIQRAWTFFDQKRVRKVERDAKRKAG